MKTSIVITSIAGADNPVLQCFANESKKRGIDFIVVADKKSPAHVNIEHCTFLDVQTQLASSFSLANLLPFNHYSRKNLGYLQAIKNRSTCIFESDDDNMPLQNFWEAADPEVSGYMAEYREWTNPYLYFGCENIYPRGYDVNANKWQNFSQLNQIIAQAPIQQYLSNGAPDIDARTRLQFGGDFFFENKTPLILPHQSYCPFNSQNTRWFSSAFPLLYLPSFCSFRTTDIWRSFIAKRILDENGFYISFHSPSVHQKRNAHNINEDLELEAENYLHNGNIVTLLKKLKLQSGTSFYSHNLLECYKMMVNEGFLPSAELPLLNAWLNDLERV